MTFPSPFASTLSPDGFKASVGQTIGVSRWFEVDQKRIDAFADVTEDWQFIHIDPARAAAETPFDGAIAHGFLTLSLLSAMAYDALPAVENKTMGVNYGFERVRFVAPVPAAARVRAQFVVHAVEERKPGELTLTYEATVEIDGSDKPALAALWLTRQYYDVAAKERRAQETPV